MAADIIIYALIAGGLIFWLRSILGTRHSDERERPNPLVLPSEITQNANVAPEAGGHKKSITNADVIKDLAATPNRGLAIDNKSAENGLIEIVGLNQSFDVKEFLMATQDVFAFVVEAFAEGDRDTLKNLLDDKVYQVFEEAIIAREKTGEILESEIQSVTEARIIEAHLLNKQAFITVRFEALQIMLTKNKEGDVLSGHAEKANKMIDIWTFSRDIKSKDPRWMVTETRGDFEDDNDVIPDSH